MTMPWERTNSVLKTGVLLKWLASPAAAESVPEEVRRRALELLRHYPFPMEMDLAGQIYPTMFACDEERAKYS